MKRWLLNLGVILSFLMLITSVFVWLASYTYVASVSTSQVHFRASIGRLIVSGSTTSRFSPDEFSVSNIRFWAGEDLEFHDAFGEQRWSVFGVRFYSIPNSSKFGRFGSFGGNLPRPPPDQWVLTVPLWHFVICFSILPLLWLFWIRHSSKRYRSKRGLCLGCGYDLRGSKEKCPECGTSSVAGSL